MRFLRVVKQVCRVNRNGVRIAQSELISILSSTSGTLANNSAVQVRKLRLPTFGDDDGK
jgi:hypothetical protein